MAAAGQLLASSLLLLPGADMVRLQVSGYSASLASYTVEGGQLVEEGRQELGPMKDMTWMHREGELVYGSHEVESLEGEAGGAVSRWRLTGPGQQLELEEWRSVGSGFPAHVLAVPGQGRLYTANYGGNSFSVLGLGSEGELGEIERVDSFPAEGESCRDDSHPHQVVARGDRVWLVDLGCDRIRHYRASPAGLELTGVTNVEAGAGPRHLALHPSLPLAFLVCELQSRVQTYLVDWGTGALILQQDLLLSSSDGDFGGEILVQGDFVYATSRGSGVVVVYRLEAAGQQHWRQLARIQEVKLAGTWPRSLVIRGSLGAVIDQKGDSLQLLAVDEVTGLVTPGPTVPTPPAPAFVHLL